ncbi:MAG: hypothetical protein OXB89_05735 [Anaerolineaceae bacterium]|nr:hypothetical protein [Anaerolineaceae bacterium]
MKGLFSERKGFRLMRDELQIDNIDSDLKNRLWNNLYSCFFEQLKYERSFDLEYSGLWPGELWASYLKLPRTRFPAYGTQFTKELENKLDSSEWYEIYDLIEAVLKFLGDEDMDKSFFTDECNLILQEEMSGYRLVGKRFVAITCEEEIRAVENALEVSPTPVKQHLERGLELLSDPKEPDYRNSIKESISAIETLCRKITEKRRTTLGEALKEIRKNEIVEVHEALAVGFEKIYGWTSDADGIRHSLMDKSILSQEDARFMLVACSTFANYLIVKADKAGINLR